MKGKRERTGPVHLSTSAAGVVTMVRCVRQEPSVRSSTAHGRAEQDGMGNSPGQGHEIVQVPSVGQPGREQLRQQCYGVRIDVFHREQGFPLESEIDELRLITSLTVVVKGFVLISAPSLQTRRGS
jgi:hypothetical protein